MYNWAHTKAYYRRAPFLRKRGRENVNKLLKQRTSPAMVLTKERVEKFAARARAHIYTCHHLEQVQEVPPLAAAEALDTPATVPPKQELLYMEIERLMKSFRGHRCALDFDRGFINSVLKEGVVS